jgi:hypothetical protein
MAKKMESALTAAPIGFAVVDRDIFRSAYPASSCYSFIRSLKLKTMICLTPHDVRPALADFVNEEGINLIPVDIGNNQVDIFCIFDNLVSIVKTFHARNLLFKCPPLRCRAS